MAQLRIKIQNLPPIVGYPIILNAGYIADDGSLTDVTADTVFTLQFGNAQQVSANVFLSNEVDGIGILAAYADGGIQTSINIQIVPALKAPTQQSIYNLLKQEEPEGVYTQSTDDESYTYIDNWTTAGLIAKAAQNGLESFLNVYPELATDLDDWYVQLFGTNLIDAVYPNQLFQQMANLQLITSASAYVVTSNIAQFIYNLTGFEVPVYINDQTINAYDYWILGNVNYSTLGVNTYLAPLSTNEIGVVYILNQGITTFTQLQTDLINNFIKSLIRPTRRYTITYNESLASLGFLLNIGNTYNGDLRLGHKFALVYDPTAFYGFIAYLNDVEPSLVTALRIDPPSGSSITGKTIFTIYGTFGGVEADITLLTRINRNDNNALLAWRSVIPVNLAVSTNFDIQYGDIVENVTYNIL